MLQLPSDGDFKRSPFEDISRNL